MMPNKCYIRSLAQVSCQQPLTDEWMTAPQSLDGKYVPATEPVTKGIISPGEARRMGKILKRTVCTSLSALEKGGVKIPDAIVTGTGMGCMENSEKFLIDLTQNGEHCLKPTLFMQSTHNTISSLVAIMLRCHGYNNTYSHGALSFDSALLDAWLQMRSGRISTALVGSHDEVTSSMAKILEQTHPEYAIISESSMALVLSCEPGDEAAVEIENVCIVNNWTPRDVAAFLGEDDRVIVAGVNGNNLNDSAYSQVFSEMKHDPAILHYKHVFGENFSSSAMGFYVGSTLLTRQEIPAQMVLHRGKFLDNTPLDRITLLHHAGNGAWSVIRLRRL